MKNRIERVLVTALILASGCAGGDSGTNPDPNPGPDPLEVSLAPTSVVLDVGQTADLVVSVSGGSQGAAVDWACVTSDPETASARETAAGCSVTGRSPGSVTATAMVTKGNTTMVVTATVTVLAPPLLPPPLEAVLDPDQATIDLGHTVELSVQWSGGIPGSQTAWTCGSSDLLVVSVISTAAGCEAKGERPGDATITATVTKGSETVEASAEVTVLVSPFPPLQVFFQPNSATMGQGQIAELGLLILGGDPALGISWTCTAADPAVVAAVVSGTGCDVTGFDSGSTVVTAIVTRGVEEAQADANVTVTPTQGRSQADPAPVGLSVTVVIDNPSGPWTTLRLTLLETQTGPTALQTALMWGAGNGPPPAGFEYILGRFRIEVVSQDPSAAYTESEINFESVSRFGTVHPPASVTGNNPNVEQSGLTGAVWEGWVDFLSESSDNFPLAVYRRGETSEAWFELKPGA